MSKKFIFAPYVDVVTERACMLCTKDYIYVVMDKIQIDRGFLSEALSSHELQESINFEGQEPRSHIQALLSAGIDLNEIHKFFTAFEKKWKDGINIYKLEDADVFKVSKGWWFLPGSITAKFKEDKGYSIIVTGIPKTHKVAVKEFYDGPSE
jgi:hypothetical protein